MDTQSTHPGSSSSTTTYTIMDSVRADFDKGGEYSDMILACGERTWKVHSIVICPQSKRIDEEYRKLKTAKQEIAIRIENYKPETIADVIQCCYSAQYPVTAGSMTPSLLHRHAALWDFSEEFEMPTINHKAQRQIESAASQVIGIENFAPYLKEILCDIPKARKICLNIVEKHADEIFGGSAEYYELCEVIKADSQFLFELTTRMVGRQKEKAQVATSKRPPTGEAAEDANKRQKVVGKEIAKRAEDAPIATRNMPKQTVALRPEEVQCCKGGWSRQMARSAPSTQSSSAQALLKANGFVTFRCPDCRGYLDAKIELTDKFSHNCVRASKHTGAVWHAFFRGDVTYTRGEERQWWDMFERLRKVLNEHKGN